MFRKLTACVDFCRMIVNGSQRNFSDFNDNPRFSSKLYIIVVNLNAVFIYD